IRARPRARDRAAAAPLAGAVAAMRDALQKARAQMDKEAYLDVPHTLEAAQAQLAEALTPPAPRETVRPARRRR
ncbi:MAG TPA: hypothetical protein VK886_09805, partial [Vicinamibacterales bacterium]|nr:hypothetical protein [Vicinamibacterales bacterium]